MPSGVGRQTHGCLRIHCLLLATPHRPGSVTCHDTPPDTAYRLCGECGLTGDEVDWLIDANKNSTLTREQSLELFHAPFEDRRDLELCGPCAEAVLDATGAQSRNR